MVTYCFSDNLKIVKNVPLGYARIATLIALNDNHECLSQLERYVRKRKDSRQVRHHCL